MVSNISSWAEQIIIAIMIATIFEMIIPECKNKKYVKTVIGLYILFTILSPIIKNFSGGDISIAKSEYLNSVNEMSNSYNKFSTVTSNNIQETYILSLKQDIQEKLNKKGYIASQIKIETEEDGSIKKLELNISNKPINKEKNTISINKIEIQNNTTVKNETSNTSITDANVKKIKEYLSNEYGVENIKIN